MSKAVNSYLDWELNFRKKSLEKDEKPIRKDLSENQYKFNTIGISNSEFKEFMKNWKKKNF